MLRWIVVADASNARIFSTLDGRTLKLITQLNHPSSRLRAQSIDSDRPGRLSKGKNSHIRSAMESANGTHRLQIEQFAHQIGLYLQAAFDQHDFQALAVVAPPRFLGLIRAQLEAHGIPYFHHGITRECVKTPVQDLLETLKTDLAEWFRESPAPIHVRAQLT